jgi:hypothetical protein
MEKLFTRGKLKDAEQKRRFLYRLYFEIRKFCVMQDYANMDALFATTLEVESFIELGETPFELLKDE